MINFEEEKWFLRLNVETYQNSQNFAASQKIKVYPQRRDVSITPKKINNM